LALVTPSLVMVGAPHFFSRTTLRPFGPRVTLTVSASLSTPAWSRARASSLKRRSFAAIFYHSSVHDGQEVTLGEDEVLGAVQLDLGAGELRVEDLVADRDLDRDAVAVLVTRPGANGDHLADLGLLLRGVGDHQPGRSAGLHLLGRLHDHPITERLKLHTLLPPWGQRLVQP